MKLVSVPREFLEAMDKAPHSLDMKYQAQKLLDWWCVERLRIEAAKRDALAGVLSRKASRGKKNVD